MNYLDEFLVEPVFVLNKDTGYIGLYYTNSYIMQLVPFFETGVIHQRRPWKN